MDEDPSRLIENVIAYLKQQQEIFGDFELPESSSETNKVESEEETDPTNQSDAKPAPSPRNSVGNNPEENEQSSSTEENVPSKNLFAEDPEASDNIFDQIEACTSLDELKGLCEQTDVLRTDLEDTNLVFGVGNPNADLLLIGEAPGHREDKQGEPFVGKAGQLLNKILKAIELDRDDVYIANILKHRPPNNRDPKPEEVRQSIPFLNRQIDLIDPKLILCLGKVAANTLLDRNDSLKNMRGTFHKYRDRYELLVTYHPAALLRNKRFKRPTWEDVKMLKQRYDEQGGTP